MTERQTYQSGCPSPQALLEALGNGQTTLLDHVASCPACGRNQDLQQLLVTWRQLDTLPELPVSAKFGARLQAKLAAAEARERKWRLLDGIFDWLHLPALAALAGLVFWLPPPQTADISQRLERPPVPSASPQRKLSGEPALKHLQEIYQHYRSNRRI